MKKGKIVKSSIYKKLLTNSGKIVGKYFVIIYSSSIESNEILSCKEVNLNFGITASKKVGNAVKRNYCKRRIRVLIEQMNPKGFTNSMHFNIVARKSMLEKEFDDLKKDFNNCMKKLTKL